jgi:hypothetical protein
MSRWKFWRFSVRIDSDVNGTQIVSLIGSFSASSIFFKNSSAPLGSPGNTENVFPGDPKGAEEFLKKIEDAEKDPIRDTI